MLFPCGYAPLLPPVIPGLPGFPVVFLSVVCLALLPSLRGVADEGEAFCSEGDVSPRDDDGDMVFKILCIIDAYR